LPEFGKAVYYANRLIGARYEYCHTASTNEGYVKWKSLPGTSEKKKEERSRESMYDALIDSLNKTIQKLKKERQRLLFSGTPWEPEKSKVEDNISKTVNEIKRELPETSDSDQVFSETRALLDELREYRRCYPNPCFNKKTTESVREKNSGLKGEVITREDILSSEFRAWRQKERANVNHNEIVEP
jgi:hypothetical protein